jgi:hypothetical protein
MTNIMNLKDRLNKEKLCFYSACSCLIKPHYLILRFCGFIKTYSCAWMLQRLHCHMDLQFEGGKKYVWNQILIPEYFTFCSSHEQVLLQTIKNNISRYDFTTALMLNTVKFRKKYQIQLLTPSFNHSSHFKTHRVRF